MSGPGISDPFARLDTQRTFVRPNPGGRTGIQRVADAPSDAADTAAPVAGLNPLVTHANRLLLAVTQLRATRRVDDPAALRDTLAQAVRDFAAQAAASGIAPERVMAARYVLCTMIDEAAADTPWGGSGVWARNSLLSMFHNETWGGEKVFQLMARLAEKPAANRDLLELIYAALALGFEGRYRVEGNGRAQLEAVRDRLAQIIAGQRGPHPAALAEHWRGQPVAPRRVLAWLPLAATAAVMLLLLAAVHIGLSASLGRRSDPLYQAIRELRAAPPAAQAAVPPAAAPRLAQLLQPDIASGRIAVRDLADRSVVVLHGEGLFAPASATLVAEREALVGRVADALARFEGQVLVTGYTDGTPIRDNPRFPSNWHLSQARAETVRGLLLARGLPVARVRADGRADSEPLARDDSAAGRARNRRVEIILLAAPAGAAVARETRR